MKNFKLIKIVILLIGFVAVNSTYAQCDSIASMCDKHLKKGFISDGQDYRSLLLDDEIAEFNMVLYGNSTYRFAACSGLTDGNLIFSVFDKERNLLFTNKDYANAPYWDFKITNTIDCIIEASLDPNSLASGCAVLLVGFRQ
jgi:hypothetical protein